MYQRPVAGASTQQDVSSCSRVTKHKVNKHQEHKQWAFGAHGSLRSHVNNICFQKTQSLLSLFFQEARKVTELNLSEGVYIHTH